MGLKLELPTTLSRILRDTPQLERAYLVGGCVRDALLGNAGKDFDIEVFGISYEQLAHVLSRWGKTDLIGKSFGVVKLAVPGGAIYDFTIPRRDSKIAPGHKGFEIQFDPDISPEEAASRRDFTINSLMYDPRREELLDFFGGQRDLENRILRHTSDAFTEDPLRVLRGMQFAARFALTGAQETIALSRQIKAAHSELAIERIRDEWFKWASRSTVPSAGLRFLVDAGWVEHYPEIQKLSGTPQEPEWHPEGDVFVHTCHCCDALAKQPEWRQADETTRIVLMLATLAHDFGKAVTTQEAIRDGRTRIISPKHEDAGVELAETFCRRIAVPNAIVERVLPLIAAHMAHMMTVTDRSVRRLAKRLEPESIENLLLLMRADAMGRPPKPFELPETVKQLASKAQELQVQSSAPSRILLGRHLLELGLKPSPEFTTILDHAYEAQLEGKFSTLQEGFKWLERHLTSKSPDSNKSSGSSSRGLQQ